MRDGTFPPAKRVCAATGPRIRGCSWFSLSRRLPPMHSPFALRGRQPRETQGMYWRHGMQLGQVIGEKARVPSRPYGYDRIGFNLCWQSMHIVVKHYKCDVFMSSLHIEARDVLNHVGGPSLRATGLAMPEARQCSATCPPSRPKPYVHSEAAQHWSFVESSAAVPESHRSAAGFAK